jgi:hypothetical protein
VKGKEPKVENWKHVRNLDDPIQDESRNGKNKQVAKQLPYIGR